MVITTVPNAYTVQYETSFDHALQQMETKLRPNVTERRAAGERFRLNNLGAASAVEITERGGATVAQDLSNELVSITPIAAECVHRLDEFDPAHLGDVVLPGSDLVQAQAYAIAREIDERIVTAFTGSRWLGKAGTTEDTFPAGQQVAVDMEDGSTNTGLTFEKIARAAYLFDTNEVKQSERYLGIRAKQMEDLVNDILTNHSTDMTSIKMLEGSRVITEILGFKVVQAQRFAVAAGTDIASCVAWQKEQVILGIWNDRKVYMDILPEQRHALQVRTTINIGVTRRRNEGVVEILCDQSP